MNISQIIALPAEEQMTHLVGRSGEELDALMEERLVLPESDERNEIAGMILLVAADRYLNRVRSRVLGKALKAGRKESVS